MDRRKQIAGLAAATTFALGSLTGVGAAQAVSPQETSSPASPAFAAERVLKPTRTVYLTIITTYTRMRAKIQITPRFANKRFYVQRIRQNVGWTPYAKPVTNARGFANIPLNVPKRQRVTFRVLVPKDKSFRFTKKEFVSPRR